MLCGSRHSVRPVLKHGPRSLACTQVTGLCEPQRRSEGKTGVIRHLVSAQRRPVTDSLQVVAAQERVR